MRGYLRAAAISAKRNVKWVSAFQEYPINHRLQHRTTNAVARAPPKAHARLMAGSTTPNTRCMPEARWEEGPVALGELLALPAASAKAMAEGEADSDTNTRHSSSIV